MRTLGDLGPKGEPPGWSNLTMGASQWHPQGPRAPATVPTGGQGLSQVRALWSPPRNDPGAGGDTRAIVPNNEQRGWLFQSQDDVCCPGGSLARPCCRLGYKAAHRGLVDPSPGPGGADGMEAMLLSCILLLLWPSSAQADVLVQPDFDANKVPEAPMLCHASGGAG